MIVHFITAAGLLLSLGTGCKSRDSEVASYGDKGVCGGRPIPRDKSRQASNHRLECSVGVDHYIRYPIPIPDIDTWYRYDSIGDKEKMQEIGQQKPKIQWSGVIPYQTIEKWTWVDWVYGQDPSCGYTEDCWTDSDGNEHCTTTMNSCWHDETQYESRHCSNERMEFKAEYVRPSKAEWNPNITSQPYFDLLPNKYDLLPGEVEDVQIYNTARMGVSLTPQVTVGSAWNHYDERAVLVKGSSSCRFNNPTEVDVKILTKGRRIRRTPNAFRMPTDEFGDPVKPVKWMTRTVDGKSQNTVPWRLQLTDISSEMITTLARQSREETVEIEEEKRKSGYGGYRHEKDQDTIAKRRSFWKKTEVRIKLYKNMPLARDIRVTKPLYLDSAKHAEFEKYVIPLDSDVGEERLMRPTGPGPDWLWAPLGVALEPKRDYQFYVAMYQRGVPFYVQDCSDEAAKKLWSCTLGLRWENAYYSDPLKIDFQTDDYDERGILQKISDFQSKSWIGEFFNSMFGK